MSRRHLTHNLIRKAMVTYTSHSQHHLRMSQYSVVSIYGQSIYHELAKRASATCLKLYLAYKAQ